MAGPYICPNCSKPMREPPTEAHLQGRRCFSVGNRRRAYLSGLRFVPPGVYAILKLAGIPITMVEQGRGWGRWALRPGVRGRHAKASDYYQKFPPNPMVRHPWAPRTAVIIGTLIREAKREGDKTTRYGIACRGTGVWKDRAQALSEVLKETMKIVSINLGMDPTPVLLEVAQKLGLGKFSVDEGLIRKVIGWTDDCVKL